MRGAVGCDSDAPVDKRFAAQTYDEYTEPLTNAVIGSASGVTVIGSDGVAADVAASALTAAAPAPSRDGGVTGAGGSTGGGVAGSRAAASAASAASATGESPHPITRDRLSGTSTTVIRTRTS